ncbi:hypothetical protein QBC46DRAFT_339500 [Diplogelasinospora grovesii]|uniref:Uncharacterized protein n=1 Tax=Diplogelasinospora grovesii TaxID=303347 RepID=A0AAN6NB73_9PEZI|nr:hypothetical protein QBC46DRAFT_339500 [Diplogelasinospora grovesii]
MDGLHVPADWESPVPPLRPASVPPALDAHSGIRDSITGDCVHARVICLIVGSHTFSAEGKAKDENQCPMLLCQCKKRFSDLPSMLIHLEKDCPVVRSWESSRAQASSQDCNDRCPWRWTKSLLCSVKQALFMKSWKSLRRRPSKKHSEPERESSFDHVQSYVPSGAQELPVTEKFELEGDDEISNAPFRPQGYELPTRELPTHPLAELGSELPPKPTTRPPPPYAPVSSSTGVSVMSDTTASTPGRPDMFTPQPSIVTNSTSGLSLLSIPTTVDDDASSFTGGPLCESPARLDGGKGFKDDLPVRPLPQRLEKPKHVSWRSTTTSASSQVSSFDAPLEANSMSTPPLKSARQLPGLTTEYHTGSASVPERGTHAAPPRHWPAARQDLPLLAELRRALLVTVGRRIDVDDVLSDGMDELKRKLNSDESGPLFDRYCFANLVVAMAEVLGSRHIPRDVYESLCQERSAYIDPNGQKTLSWRFFEVAKYFLAGLQSHLHSDLRHKCDVHCNVSMKRSMTLNDLELLQRQFPSMSLDHAKVRIIQDSMISTREVEMSLVLDLEARHRLTATDFFGKYLPAVGKLCDGHYCPSFNRRRHLLWTLDFMNLWFQSRRDSKLNQQALAPLPSAVPMSPPPIPPPARPPARHGPSAIGSDQSWQNPWNPIPSTVNDFSAVYPSPPPQTTLTHQPPTAGPQPPMLEPAHPEFTNDSTDGQPGDLSLPPCDFETDFAGPPQPVVDDPPRQPPAVAPTTSLLGQELESRHQPSFSQMPPFDFSLPPTPQKTGQWIPETPQSLPRTPALQRNPNPSKLRTCCKLCNFRPASGPGQQKKLRKHEETRGHITKMKKDADQFEEDEKTQEKRFPCGWTIANADGSTSICGAVYNRRDNLQGHVKNAHLAETHRNGMGPGDEGQNATFACRWNILDAVMCPKVFASKDDLQQHLSKEHILIMDGKGNVAGISPHRDGSMPRKREGLPSEEPDDLSHAQGRPPKRPRTGGAAEPTMMFGGMMGGC